MPLPPVTTSQAPTPRPAPPPAPRAAVATAMQGDGLVLSTRRTEVQVARRSELRHFAGAAALGVVGVGLIAGAAAGLSTLSLAAFWGLGIAGFGAIGAGVVVACAGKEIFEAAKYRARQH